MIHWFTSRLNTRQYPAAGSHNKFVQDSLSTVSCLPTVCITQEKKSKPGLKTFQCFKLNIKVTVSTDMSEKKMTINI